METPSSGQNPEEFYAQTYNDSVHDWPGEIDFYHEIASPLKSKGGSLLELACGTGRVAIRLAQEGIHVVGIDLMPEMIAIARRKSAGIKNIRWEEGDMRSFNLRETFDLALIPGHAFQNLNTPQDQIACLKSIWRHLNPGAKLVVHLDHMNRENTAWLGDLCGELRGVFEPAEQITHPETGQIVQASRAWSYEPSSQTATVQTVWEELNERGEVVKRIERSPVRLHCVFRFEMEHLLARVGFVDAVVYGSFFRHPLLDDSTDMIWVAIRP